MALAMAPPRDARDADPWWRYLAAQGRRGAVWLDEVRRASTTTVP